MALSSVNLINAPPHYWWLFTPRCLPISACQFHCCLASVLLPEPAAPPPATCRHQLGFKIFAITLLRLYVTHLLWVIKLAALKPSPNYYVAAATMNVSDLWVVWLNSICVYLNRPRAEQSTITAEWHWNQKYTNWWKQFWFETFKAPLKSHQS